MAFTGDADLLRQLAQKMRQLASPAFRQEMAKALGAAALKALHDGFRRGVDPYGRPWKKLKSRTGQPLRDRGVLEASYSVQPSAGGFSLGTNLIQATVHQYGAVIVPKSKTLLRFQVRGKPTKSNKRGKLSGWIYAKKVTIDQRQMVPEMETGGLGNWGEALNREAAALLDQHFGM